MNFFDAQDQARRATRRLVVAYIFATVVIVAGVTAIIGFAIFTTSYRNRTTVENYLQDFGPFLVGVAVFTTLFIIGASLFKTAALSSGGGKVAAQLGGTLVSADVQDPLRRRLRNVVEEMAIASGVPVPEIYVLEQESAINAFAAGYSPGDAAVAVTRGALEVLNRDELQGVIAHEFSHILNGDMRLNIRLMGVLFGIMVLGLIGRIIVRGGVRSGAAVRNRKAPVVMIIGVGLAILGGIGVISARIIKAGVSRQREYLADASAVQFTRQSSGIANALKKIGGFQHGSHLQESDPEEVSHMLFGTGSKLRGMFATHPPLVERIQALDPHFVASDFPVIDLRERQKIQDESVAGFAPDVTTALASGGAAVMPDTIVDTVGQPENEHVEFAEDLRRSIPERLYAASHSRDFAFLLTIALVLDRTGTNLERQLGIVREKVGAERSELVNSYYQELRHLGAEYRLPLLEIAFPALKLRPTPQLTYLTDLVRRLIEIDGKVDLYEYCFYRVLAINLRQALDPVSAVKTRKRSRSDVQQAALDLLRIVADYGHTSKSNADAAFAAGVAKFGSWAALSRPQSSADQRIDVLDRSLEILRCLRAGGRQTLLKAISAVVTHDRKLAVAEAELLRAVCATLDCPLPPILVFKEASP